MRSARAADRLKAVRSEQPFRAQAQPPRRYLSAGASPVALTPSFSSLSPLYPLAASPHSVVSSASSATLDDAIGRLFTRYLPTFFDLLEKYQYQKALLILEDEEETQWKGWEAFKVMLKLSASCESTYHLMKYVEAELVQTDTIEQLYGKLVVLMNHLADELKPIVERQSIHFSVRTPSPSGTGNGNAGVSRSCTGDDEAGDSNDYISDPMLMMEIAMCGDMSYYVELLEQGAEFFSLRVPMIQIYRGLALSTGSRDYHSWSKRFYRSLVAKFTLYFHRWLEPFEKKTDYLSLELSRFIKTPLGISYLQLMDVLLSKASRGDGSKIRVMLILETQALENNGAHYYENGYRCPGSSNALYTRTDREKQDDKDEQGAKQKAIASTGSADTSGRSSRTHSPASSRGGGASPAHGRRRSLDQQSNHALFMRVDREENEEQNDFSELWGLRSWPAVFCYPEGSSLPLDHWPNIVSLIMDNRSSLDSVRPVFMHAERRQKTTYHISRVDEAMYLVLLAEGVKKSNEKVAQDFMQTVTENLQHSGAFAPRVLAATTSTTA
ncbi:hypothetical protein PR001_g19392 [Phytophthora rubi]|uniref:Uncharacterized protein n=1 Tax=Phytophthora rubi TaxID=129364 RepID=A0A6A3JTN9_9STRA|nr:hypothetical protein PR001_g19392 [Phytophthora rubi]